jgi:hypothetical protein
MRLRLAVAAAILTGLAAAERNVSPLIRGTLIARELLSSGEFSVRAADSQVFHYRFDAKTYVERDDRLVDIPRLDIGDKVEVLSDEGPASAVRYARTVHVLYPETRRVLSQGRFRADRMAADHFGHVSTLSFAGVVSNLGAGWVVLHTRASGDQTIRLRQDTRYLNNGEQVDITALQPNMRVFIRAGRNLYDEVEAYQVMWGEILEPR